MSKDPAILFYYKDFDSDTADWEADAIGWYMRLLIFQSGNGYVPSDLEELAQVARVRFSDYQIFSERWAKRLACKFKPLSEGKLYNTFLSKVQSKRKTGAIKKSVLAVFGNFIKSTELSLEEEKEIKKEFHKQDSFFEILNDEKRKNEILNFLNQSLINIKQRIAKRTQQGNGNEIGNGNENINRTITEINKSSESEISEIEVWPTFEDFWDHYDKKVGSKSKIEKKWDKLNHQTKEQIMSHVEAYKQSQPDKQYRKNPETYFNNESWNDEIIATQNNPQQSKTTQQFNRAEEAKRMRKQMQNG